MARLLATAADRERIGKAGSAVVLVGSYDGSGNYGDVLQLAAAIETVGRVPGDPLPVAIVEQEMAGQHLDLTKRHDKLFAGAAFVYFEDGRGTPVDGLLPLDEGSLPRRSALHLYGGGHLNRWWAARKLEHRTAAGWLAGGRSLPTTASGLQVDETVAAGGPTHELLAGASWVGLRDGASLELADRHLGGDGGPSTRLTGDDATPLVASARGADPEAVVNLHLNLGSWVSDDPERRGEKIVRMLCALGDAAGGSLELQPVVAYEDRRVSERHEIAELLERSRRELDAHGLRPLEPLDILDDVLENGLASFRRARLTVSCSYHVTLTSLLAGIPAVLLADNPYYDQKAAGLRALFDMPPGLLGVCGDRSDAAMAAEALVDGAVRSAAIAALDGAGARVLARHEELRQELADALSAGLAGSRRGGMMPAVRQWLLARLHRLVGRLVRPHLAHFARVEAVGQLETRVAAAAAGVEASGALAGSAKAEAEDALARADHALARADDGLAAARDLGLPARIAALATWLELSPPTGGPDVAIVLATRDRPALLARAVDSVLAQRYARWRLLVVDDGSSDDSKLSLHVSDDRIEIVEGPRRGLGAARNAGLERAVGDVVCYLDDDNVMHPAWLQAIASVFATRPDVEVMYGVSVAEHRVPGGPADDWWPAYWQRPWSRKALLEENLTDAGAIAHRRDLDGARFDEGLRSGEDWDLLLRLTETRPALAVPAVSHAYAIDTPGRMSDESAHRAALDEVRRRHAAT
ncbi:MAG TPA: glycosyltransferase [Solirubrobacteraceae bacterium]|nr:glycosyltransferase [Solirubrobacteraceae bacterium]